MQKNIFFLGWFFDHFSRKTSKKINWNNLKKKISSFLAQNNQEKYSEIIKNGLSNAK